jgi:hypothetical protein
MKPPDTAVIRLGGHQLDLRREQLLFCDEHVEHDVPCRSMPSPECRRARSARTAAMKAMAS